MLDKLNSFKDGATDAVGVVTNEVSEAAGKVAESTIEASVARSLNVMEMAARVALERPMVREVTLTMEVGGLVGKLSISATFDPEVLVLATTE